MPEKLKSTQLATISISSRAAIRSFAVRLDHDDKGAYRHLHISQRGGKGPVIHVVQDVQTNVVVLQLSLLSQNVPLGPRQQAGLWQPA